MIFKISKFQSSNISNDDSAEVHSREGGGLEEVGGRLVSESDSKGSLIGKKVRRERNEEKEEDRKRNWKR